MPGDDRCRGKETMCGRGGWTFGLLLSGTVAIASCQNISLGPLVTPSYESQLAEYLSQTGATMYGAYWCPHCARQKQLFGQAAKQLPYIECDPRGVNAQVALCNTAGISAYPTWQINGAYYLGVQSLNQLANLSGFENESAPADSDSGSGGFSPAP